MGGLVYRELVGGHNVAHEQLRQVGRGTTNCNLVERRDRGEERAVEMTKTATSFSNFNFVASNSELNASILGAGAPLFYILSDFYSVFNLLKINGAATTIFK